MRRLLALALVLAAAALAGTARADTFEVVGGQSLAGVVLPTAALPNLPGAVAFPADLSLPPAAPETLSDQQLLTLWQAAGAAYGVPWTVLAAINKVESDFGRNLGPSTAGAVGWMQFLPSTWLEWGVDANGDGIADPWNAEDAVYSAARYLAAAGASGDVAGAVYAYNHADWYVSEVLALAAIYGQGASVTFSLDRLQAGLDQARAAVAAASGRLVEAQQRARSLAAVVAEHMRLAEAQSLLSARLAQEQLAGAVREKLVVAQSAAGQARSELAAARSDLVQARAAAAPSSFAAGLTPLLAAPSFSAGWAFPVGGGAATVSVSRSHAGYPAADIAAPAGSPAYALADGVVERAWAQPDQSCGIGFVYRSADGQTWTYCHLAYLEPSVSAGAALSAGAPVGLVGSTGDASGPHLHLQLDPASAYPQDEPWFQALAGTAFSWQDTQPQAPPATGLRFLAAAGASPASAGGPVFAVVGEPAPAASPPVVLFTRP